MANFPTPSAGAWAFEDSTNKDTYDLYDTILGSIMNGTGTTDKDGNDITVNGSSATVNNVEYTATTSVSLDLTIAVEQIQGTDGDTTLAAGLYDADGNLIVPYATIAMDAETDYTKDNYNTEASSPYCILNKLSTYSNVYIVLPDEVTKIGNYAFYNYTSLKSITILGGITKIGEYAFKGCRSLTSVTIPDSVTSIGTYAFSDTSLTSVTIPDSVTEIGYGAFWKCKSLTSITIPDSVTSIGQYAFSNCTSLTSVTIPDSVTSIGGSAFSYCDKLTSVVIGNGVTSIEESAFKLCSSLTSVTFKVTAGWWYASSSSATSGTSILSTNLDSPTNAATYLKSTYCGYYWKRS